MSSEGAERKSARATPPVTRYLDIACRGIAPEEFFPSSGHRPVIAMETCGRCSHIDECRDWAVSSGQLYGIWGGTTAKARIRMRSRKVA
jgi:WhiB family redox-sensing transcriptional regulator